MDQAIDGKLWLRYGVLATRDGTPLGARRYRCGTHSEFKKTRNCGISQFGIREYPRYWIQGLAGAGGGGGAGTGAKARDKFLSSLSLLLGAVGPAGLFQALTKGGMKHKDGQSWLLGAGRGADASAGTGAGAGAAVGAAGESVAGLLVSVLLSPDPQPSSLSLLLSPSPSPQPHQPQTSMSVTEVVLVLRAAQMVVVSADGRVVSAAWEIGVSAGLLAVGAMSGSGAGAVMNALIQHADCWCFVSEAMGRAATLSAGSTSGKEGEAAAAAAAVLSSLRILLFAGLSWHPLRTPQSMPQRCGGPEVLVQTCYWQQACSRATGGSRLAIAVPGSESESERGREGEGEGEGEREGENQGGLVAVLAACFGPVEDSADLGRAMAQSGGQSQDQARSDSDSASDSGSVGVLEGWPWLTQAEMLARAMLVLARQSDKDKDKDESESAPETVVEAPTCSIWQLKAQRMYPLLSL